MKVIKGIFVGVVSALVALFLVIGVLAPVQRAKTKSMDPRAVEVKELPEKQPLAEEGYVQLAEVRMHYLRYGTGEKAVILIHGNGGSASSLTPIAEYLANEYTVYCIADRCQGKSSDPGEISYELMANDVYQFISIMKLEKPYVVGHSDGGMVAIALAANHPDSIAAFVSFGANSHPKTFKFYFTVGVWFNNLFHKDKLNDLMLNEPDFNKEYLARITVPAYIVAGEMDIMHIEDVKYIADSIAGSKVFVVKDADHSSYVCDGRGYTLAKEFFDGLKEE